MKQPKNSGLMDLSAAVAVVHPHRLKEVEPLDPEGVDRLLLLAAGDHPDRASFFDHDEKKAPYEKDGQRVLLTMDRKALNYDYRDLENRREHRSMITIPPKLRENIVALCGEASKDDVLMTTALVALADYAAMILKRDGKRLHVCPATDGRAEERRKLRRQIADQAGSR